MGANVASHTSWSHSQTQLVTHIRPACSSRVHDKTWLQGLLSARLPSSPAATVAAGLLIHFVFLCSAAGRPHVNHANQMLWCFLVFSSPVCPTHLSLAHSQKTIRLSSKKYKKCSDEIFLRFFISQGSQPLSVGSQTRMTISHSAFQAEVISPCFSQLQKLLRAQQKPEAAFN